MEKAKALNDTKKVQELDAWGGLSRRRRTNNWRARHPSPTSWSVSAGLPAEIAKKARVAMIVADLLYADSSVEKVDVTEMLLDWLKADERTRTIVRGLK